MKHILYSITMISACLFTSCGEQKNQTETDEQAKVEQTAAKPEASKTKHDEIVNLSVEEYSSLVSSEPFVVVDFYATWCRPCKKMAPHLRKIAGEYEDNQFKLVQIDAERNVALSKAEGIEGYPTLKLYKDGREVMTKMGGMNEAQLRALFAEYL